MDTMTAESRELPSGLYFLHRRKAEQGWRVESTFGCSWANRIALQEERTGAVNGFQGKGSIMFRERRSAAQTLCM